MSRNFELLQRIGREQALYTTSPVAEPEPFQEQPVVFSGPVASPLAISASELEEFTKLVQRLFIMPGNDSPRSVVFAATEQGNGCSWVCARVADVLASQVSGSVCLVDANLRRPGLHEQFSAENNFGLSDALIKPDPVRSFARTVGRANLWMVSCGSNVAEGQNLLSTDRMRLRMSELRAEFDYVLSMWLRSPTPTMRWFWALEPTAWCWFSRRTNRGERARARRRRNYRTRKREC